MANKIQEVFDMALKQSKGGNPRESYLMNDGREYYAYYSNIAWNDYLGKMQKEHSKAFNEFKNGDGGELFEKESSSGKLMPPKMASYASSSRFIFEESIALGEKMTFECKLPIAFRGYRGEAKASLDGYISSQRIFIEAKCHEFYAGSPSVYKLAYKDFYDYLNKETRGLFSYTIKHGKSNDYISFEWNGRKLHSLDLKQLLCHMLGIAKKALLDDSHQKSTLLYLVYKPENNMLSYVSDPIERQKIVSAWELEKAEAQEVDFSLLYNLIVHFIAEYKKSSAIIFSVCQLFLRSAPFSNQVDATLSGITFRANDT